MPRKTPRKKAPNKTPGRTLNQWWQTPAGRELWQRENALLQATLPQLFGYHALWFGATDYSPAAAASPIGHHTRLQRTPGEIAPGCNLLGRYQHLPIRRDSVDVAVLPHILEYSRSPHALLREAERVLHPSGHLIIIGFNPLSGYGLCRAMLGPSGDMPWQGRFYHPWRVRDWLQPLGFEVRRVQYAALAPPSHRAARRRARAPNPAREAAGPAAFVAGLLGPLGGVYMVLARNLALTPTVIRPAWKKKPLPTSVAEPSTRAAANSPAGHPGANHP